MTEMEMPKHCPAVGAGARMTRPAFVTICLAEQNRVTINDKMLAIFKPICLRCAIGHEVKRLAGLLAKELKESDTGLVSANEFYGRLETRFSGPPGMNFVTLKKLQEERSMMSAERQPVPKGNWKPMTYEQAEALQPKDLIKIWATPPIKKQGTCPNCRRPNLTQACFGICGACRKAVKNGMHGIEMLAALAAKGEEKHAEWQINGQAFARQANHSEGMLEMVGKEQNVAAADLQLVLADDFLVQDSPEFLVEQDQPLPISGDQPENGLDAADEGFWKHQRERLAVETDKHQDVNQAGQADANTALQSCLDRAAEFLVLPGYESLAGILQEAMDQAQSGKGVERHAGAGEPFDEQMICAITRRVGLGFPLGQAIKKAVESKRLGGEAGRREILGAINYLSAAVICGREGVE